MKEAARGTAAAACLPSKEDLNAAYFDLRGQIDEIVAEAKAKGSLQIALSGLNALRQYRACRALIGRAPKSTSRCRTISMSR
jgi:hypothetical protein